MAASGARQTPAASGEGIRRLAAEELGLPEPEEIGNNFVDLPLPAGQNELRAALTRPPGQPVRVLAETQSPLVIFPEGIVTRKHVRPASRARVTTVSRIRR